MRTCHGAAQRLSECLSEQQAIPFDTESSSNKRELGCEAAGSHFLRSKSSGRPVGTRTPDLYRVKVGPALRLIAICM
jgi:hypothetical protein